MKTLLKGALLTSALLTSSLSFADQSFAQPQQPTAQSASGKFYIGASVNYTHSDWKTMLGANGTSFTDWKNSTGGIGFGAYAGYMMTNHIGAELGWNRAPTVKFNLSYQSSPYVATSISTNMFYAAFVMSNQLPIAQNITMFLKVGPGYQRVHVTGGTDAINSMNAIGLYGAVGLTYAITPNIGISAQAAGLSGQTNHNKGQYTTNPYIYSVSLAYLF